MTALRIALIAMSTLLFALPAAALPAALPDASGLLGQPDGQVHSAAAVTLRGTFRVTAASCSGAISGSYFRMIQPGGTLEAGPFVENSDSTCANKTYTPLKPGSDKGLVTGSFQPQPEAAFDAPGNGTATRIVAPAKFFGVNFALASNATDPQTGTATTAPTIRRDGTKLSGDLRALGVAWNRQHFNQGAPKPDGSTPGLTRVLTGSIDAGTKAYAFTWSSTIVGGPFNNFTGLWHFEGVFDGDIGGTQATAPSPAPTTNNAPNADSAQGPADAAPTTPRTGPALPAALGLAGLALAGGLKRGRRNG